MTTVDLRRALWRFRWLALAVFVVVTGLGAATALLPNSGYESQTTLLAAPEGDRAAFGFGATEASQVLVPPVIRRIESEDFAAEVESALETGGVDPELRVTGETEAGTALITMSTVTSRPEFAQPAADVAIGLLAVDPISTLIEVTAVNPPEEPTSLASQRAVPTMIGSVTLAAILAILTAVAAYSVRRRVAGPQLVRERFNLEVLGELPAVKSVPDAPTLVETGLPAELFESYQRLRANFEILVRANRSVVAITSWDEREGKTSVTANLAWSLATLGHEVVAIDADLRKPRLHQALGVDLAPGLAEADANGWSLTEVCQQTSLPDLVVVSAGEPARHPAAIVGASLASIRTVADGATTLIDTPPMLAAETTTIMSAVDGVIVVLDVKRRSPAELEEALHEISLTRAKVLGVVLNRSERPETRRGSDYYHSVWKHRTQRGPASEPPLTTAPSRRGDV